MRIYGSLRAVVEIAELPHPDSRATAPISE